MSVSRTPRKWDKGDEEPQMLLGVALKVRDNQGDVWTYNDRNGFWYTPDTKPYPWEHIARKWGPLTEVLPEQAETTEPGCCDNCQGTGASGDPDTNGACSDCYATGHAHDGPCLPPAQLPQEAPNPPVPVSVDTRTPKQDDSGQLGAELAEMLAAAIATGALHSMAAWERADDDLKNSWRLYGSRAAHALLAARWRPPLPKADVATLVSAVGGIISELAALDDEPDLSRTIAKELLDAGYLDKTGALGPPEPVATTLRRILRDLEGEAIRLDGQSRDIGGFTEQRIDHIIGAQTLRDYAERLRSHPVLSGEGTAPLPACDCQPFDDCAKCWTQVDPREVAIRQLASCETSVQAGVEPDDGEQCPNPRERGSLHCAEHQPPPQPDYEGGEAELAAVLAHVIRDFTNDLPVKDCQRIAAGAAHAAWNAPLPADETEWMRRCPSTAPESALIPEDRQCQLANGHSQAHTWCGDKGEFSSWARVEREAKQ